ncbi:MAG: M23 family metallopeptidase [bacterium]|nr:MAG: M23 family metallopeptidase [bacterium]
MAHKKHKKKFLNILLIPDDESNAKNFRIRFSVLTAALLLIIFIFVGIVIGAFTYGQLLQKAYENISLRQQNEQLLGQLQKVNELTTELDNLKGYGKKVRNSLIGYVNLQGNPDEVASDSDEDSGSNQSLFSIFNSIPLKAPVTGFLSQDFNQNIHNGVDIVAPEGTPIVASGNGVILFSGWTTDGGNTIVIGHKGGYYSYYKHNLRNLVYENQLVEQGEVIGYLGNSGQKSYGPHLHFEIWKDGAPIDPRLLVLDLNK